VYVAVGSSMSLPDPRLAEVATASELTHLETGFLAFKSAGQVIKGTVNLDPRVMTVTRGQATLRDCYLSSILRYDRETGQPEGAAPTDRTLVTVTLQLVAGTWKVAAITHVGDGCASNA
jgi:hypothetical protein